jgi:hypothetical protein
MFHHNGNAMDNWSDRSQGNDTRKHGDNTTDNGNDTRKTRKTRKMVATPGTMETTARTDSGRTRMGGR